MMNQNGSFNFQNFLQNAIQRNPQVQQNLQQNPQMQNYLQVLMSGDAQRGEEMARNLCQSMGISPEQGVQQAQQMVQQMFGGRMPF